MHNAALRRARAERLALPAAAGRRPSCSPRPSRALGAAGFAGANVTIPHKEAALALADEATAAARAIGAANTLTFGPGGAIARRQHRRARASSPRSATARPRTALVLGAGGSARAAV